MKNIIISAIFLSLVACSTGTNNSPSSKNKNSVRFSALTLKQTVTIPSSSAHVYFQNGKIVRNPNRFDPYCGLEVNTVSRGLDTINASTFLIGKTYTVISTDEIVENPFIGVSCLDSIYYIDHYQLSSQKPSDIRDMTCYQYSSNGCTREVSRQGVIQQAAGAYLSIR